MTYIFIINPAAGRSEWVKKTLFDLQLMSQGKSAEIKFYITEKSGHATQLAQNSAKQHKNVRIYACGGDGTVNEVLQGIIGYEHVEFGCIPIGSGNDFVKNFQGNDFMDLSGQLSAPSASLDVVNVSGDFGSRYAINVVSFSWDSRVAIEVEGFKKLPFVSGGLAYGLSTVNQLLKKKDTNFSIRIDEEFLPNKNYMIGMCANGGFYGGGFNGAPFARLDDGLLDIVLVETITRKQVVSLFPKFKAGTHLTRYQTEFKDLLTYRKGRNIEILSDEDLPVTIDGEEFHTKQLKLKVLEKKVRFILPVKNIED